MTTTGKSIAITVKDLMHAMQSKAAVVMSASLGVPAVVMSASLGVTAVVMSALPLALVEFAASDLRGSPRQGIYRF